ncbi:MAG: DUF4824 family protein [Planctomycetes bacterium]|nr:DUF4824 family protein [Planctomycetota bacterium]
MRRALLLAAVAVVLVAQAWILIEARRNQRDPRGGTVELTERELRLVPMPAESTVILLELRWKARSAPAESRRSPPWLDAAKLAELGFDCGMPVSSPEARDHYAAMPSVPVFLVLEYEGESGKSGDERRKSETRLQVVDAGRDAPGLRERYPDLSRHIITRGLVRISYQDRSIPDDAPLATPRLQGWIQTILPGEIYVPLPYSRILDDFRRQERSESEEEKGEPRFAAMISWGTNSTPWVHGIRRL